MREKEVEGSLRLRDRERCKERRLCFHCKSTEHGIKECEGYKKKMSEMKASYLANGKVWDNRDGTFTHPDGSIRNQPDPISHVKKVQASHSAASTNFNDAGVYDELPSVNYLVSAQAEVPAAAWLAWPVRWAASSEPQRLPGRSITRCWRRQCTLRCLSLRRLRQGGS